MDNKEGKGKGKARSNGTEPEFQLSSPSGSAIDSSLASGESLPSRILSSAAALSSSMIHSTLTADAELAQSIASTEKGDLFGQPSAHGPGTEALQAAQPSTAMSSTQFYESIRTEPSHTDEDWPELKSSLPALPIEYASEPMESLKPVHQTPHSSHHIIPEDGAAVVSLLADPTFHAQTSTPPTNEFPMADEDEQLNEDISPTDLKLLLELKLRLPDPPTHTAPEPTNPLNLIPDFGAAEPQDIEFKLPAFGEEADDANREDWLNDWRDVLSQYADVVWGGFQAICKKAQKELEEVKEGERKASQAKAVERIGQLLGHLNYQDHGEEK
ncbi:MAG: hypothetical protein M1824_004275 [Vezdaea acicularis]|nr:MAG: hypothetical protein M1824_004275 [Vezdaea acicularis]